MIGELKIFGGPPTFSTPLHVGRPNLGDKSTFLSRMERVYESRHLTNDGPFLKEFEAKLAEYLKVPHVVAMCNATVALEIAIRALDLTGEVLVPSFTFVATAHALQWQMITPVFCDIEPTRHGLDPATLERMRTPRTSGIIGVHTWGKPCEIERIVDFARANRLKVLFDAAHAFACSRHGTRLGSFGDAEVFSFHGTKFLNSFEGGAVATQDGDLAEKMRLMRNFGFAGYDRVIYIGTNGKMSEASAVMGLTNFEAIDNFISVNRRNQLAYRNALAGLDGLRLLSLEDQDEWNYQYVVTEYEAADETDLTRDELFAILHGENVLVRRYFHPGCHRAEPYASYYPHAHLLLPVTESVAARTLTFPTGTAIGPSEIATIGELMRYIFNNRHDIAQRLRAATV